MGFRDRTFNIEGVPITFYEIEMWYTELLRSNKEHAEKIGNPYKSNDVCEYIAKLIYNEMIQKINKKFGINSDNKKERNKYQTESKTEQRFYENSYDNVNSWSSNKKFIEIMNFAKQKAYEQQYGKQQKKEDTQNINLQKTFDWKNILQIPKNKELTERLIKICFRKLARKYHPDLQHGDENKMRELIEARNKAFEEIRN